MKNKKTIVVITLLIIVSFFIIGADWASEVAHRLFHSYFADIAIPFGFYLLLVLVAFYPALGKKPGSLADNGRAFVAFQLFVPPMRRNNFIGHISRIGPKSPITIC